MRTDSHMKSGVVTFYLTIEDIISMLPGDIGGAETVFGPITASDDGVRIEIAFSNDGSPNGWADKDKPWWMK